jgi:hypothetical protein
MPMHITVTHAHVAHIELSSTVAQQKKTHDRLAIFEIEALNGSFFSTHHHRSGVLCKSQHSKSKPSIYVAHVCIYSK